MKIKPMPSPRGTNHERLFVVHLPNSSPSGAYDSMRDELENPEGREYDFARQGRDDEPAGRAKLRRALEAEGFSDADVEELFALMDGKARDSAMPRNAIEGGMGGRDRRDRKMAGDAAARREFAKCFPEAARIGDGTDTGRVRNAGGLEALTRRIGIA